MRIGMLASSYPRFPGDPSGVFIASLARAVADLGHSVHVVAPADPLAVDRDAEAGPVSATRFSYSPWSSLQPMGYGKALVNDRHLRLAAWAFAAPYFLSATAHLLARQDQWDVVHVHWLLPNGPPGLVAGFLGKKPVVLTLHGSDVYLAAHSSVLRPLARRCMAAAGAVVACSPEHIEIARGLGAGAVALSLIPWGGDAERFASADGSRWRRLLDIPPDRKVILALGRLVEKKGFHRLLEAFAAVCSPAVLVVAGDGPMRGPLTSATQHLGVRHNVRFCGTVPSTDVPDLMAMANLVAVPSVCDQSGNQDGLPTVALEAMAAGKPVIASALGGLPMVVEDGVTGVLVPPDDVPGLSHALRRLLDDSKAAEAMGAAGLARVRGDLSWRTTARRYSDVYENARTAQTSHRRAGDEGKPR